MKEVAFNQNQEVPYRENFKTVDKSKIDLYQSAFLYKETLEVIKTRLRYSGDDNDLIDKLVVFNSETEIELGLNNLAKLNGKIVAILIGDSYDQGLGVFKYVANFPCHKKSTPEMIKKEFTSYFVNEGRKEHNLSVGSKFLGQYDKAIGVQMSDKDRNAIVWKKNIRS